MTTPATPAELEHQADELEVELELGELVELDVTIADLIPPRARTWTYAVLAALQPATTALAVAVETARVPLAVVSGVIVAAGFGVALVHRPA